MEARAREHASLRAIIASIMSALRIQRGLSISRYGGSSLSSLSDEGSFSFFIDTKEIDSEP